MKCPICGTENDSNYRFCAKCGSQMTAQVQNATQSPHLKANKLSPALLTTIIVSGAAVLTLITILILVFALNAPVSDEKAQVIMEQATEHILNYEYDEANSLLKDVKLRDDSIYKETLSELLELSEAQPAITNVDTNDYPNVTVQLESGCEYNANDFELIYENYSSDTINNITRNGNTYTFTYEAPEDYGGQSQQDKISFIKYENIDFALPIEYISEDVDDVNISLVTSNVDNYPEISLYFKVVDNNNNPIENLSQQHFSVKEYLNINDYMERDIIYAGKVNQNDALNVSIAIDRSGSIDDDDMEKIKNATNTFLSKLQFGSGDKAEIVSFETKVMQMCLFTNNKNNLMYGVNSMYPYGLTACYDAIITSIKNASVQSGTRCVIVFTDGIDNESTNTVSDVINLANEKSVPVYTIGVGNDLKEADLRKIANSTGGTYHHIDDISAMSKIYEEIYREQRSLYHVKYVSDTSLKENSERRIVAKATGNGYRGKCDKTYTPIIPVVAGKHSARYEVIKADVSWEEANRICIEKGGHLATITSKDEEQKIIAVAEKAKVERLWIGGYTTNNRYDEAVGHWIMGEPFEYQNWYSANEPSRFDSDNEEEMYLMLWKIDGRWSWNDQRNDLINSQFASTYKGQMGYVIEYEN